MKARDALEGGGPGPRAEVAEVEALRARSAELERELRAARSAGRRSSFLEGEYDDFLDAMGLGLLIRDLDGRFLRANRVFQQLLGFSEKEVLGMQCSSITHPEDYEALGRQHVPRLLSGEANNLQLEFRLLHRRGHVVWIHASILLVRDAAGSPQHLAAIVRDITGCKLGELERLRLLDDVCAAREALQKLSGRLVQAQEAERRRIALELHDQVGQALTGLKLGLENLPAEPQAAFGARLGEITAALGDLIRSVRDLSLDLRPAMLDDLGLLPALLWLVERFSAQAGIEVVLEHAGLEGRFPPEMETSAYRIVQESLTNVARHARVKKAVVRAWADAEALSVQVEDKGVGFDRKVRGSSALSTGLLGMEERCLMLGGQLTVETAPGEGTRVIAELPLGAGKAVSPA